MFNRLEFKDLFDSFDYETVRNQILNRQMLTCPFTTVLWRVFLHCLPRDSSQWNQIIDASRDTYDELVDKYSFDLKKIRQCDAHTKNLNHPLSREENVRRSFNKTLLFTLYFYFEEFVASVLCIY